MLKNLYEVYVPFVVREIRKDQRCRKLTRLVLVNVTIKSPESKSVSN